MLSSYCFSGKFPADKGARQCIAGRTFLSSHILFFWTPIGLVIDTDRNLTGKGWQRLTPFGVEVLHVHGEKLGPFTVQPIRWGALQGWMYVWGNIVGGS